ncbi:MAG: cobalamin-dependent protein [Melioribacteraceae bacterium]|nr:cobalamin-dependent protein [Melioribacteraceae bacterium]
MNELLNKLAVAIARGKVNQKSPFPPDMKGEFGADELTKQALEESVAPAAILNDGLMIGMKTVGDKFESGKAFIPDMLIAAKAMNVAMVHLKPFFDSGEVELKGDFILGTVAGDLHDIGKNIVRMVLTGNGWNVIDLGTDVKPEQFIETLKEYPNAVIGMSALLTTTMMQMETTTTAIKEVSPDTKIYIGGAPISQEFSDKIGADGYFPDPNKFAKHLASVV